MYYSIKSNLWGDGEGGDLNRPKFLDKGVERKVSLSSFPIAPSSLSLFLASPLPFRAVTGLACRVFIRKSLYNIGSSGNFDQRDYFRKEY